MVVSIQMSQDWLNSEEQSSKNYNLENSFYSNRSRVGLTGFLFDCFAGKQEDDLESAPSSTSAKIIPVDESLTSALFSSTKIISSAISSLTTSFAGLFTWAASSEPEAKITELKTFAPQELFEVIVEGEKPISASQKVAAVIEDTKSPAFIETIRAAEIKEMIQVTEPVIQHAIQADASPLVIESAIKYHTNTNTVESPKMNDISYDETCDKKPQQAAAEEESGEYVDPSDFWYKEEDEDLFEQLLSSQSFYGMPSYIDFSQDSSIKVQPIPKRKDSKQLKVHFEPLVELMDYVVNNDKAAIKKVLQAGRVKVNDFDKLGYTMLHYAASHNHSDLLKYLIEKEGADVNCVDSTDWTPLHLAAIADNYKACKVLLDHGANFEYPNCDDNLSIDLTEDAKIKNLLAEATKKKLSSKKVRAIYNWQAESPEFLTVKKSEVLKVLERRQELWLVQNDAKQIGLVPRIFIQ